jgi:precorrin-6B methylase 2
VRVVTPLGGVVDTGPDGLAILSLFARPRMVSEALAALEQLPVPRPDPAPAASAIESLIEAGAIVEEGESGDRWGWTDPAEHARMLDDARRTDAFVGAIRETVRPDDVVLDIGTGSGILAIVAALAGARQVYAVEASDIATIAERAIVANGVADRVTLVRGWSTQVELPERASLLVSEVIGAEPLEEDLLRTTLDARRRLLRPDARLIPQRLDLVVQPVSVAQVNRWASRVEPTSVSSWRDSYGVDLSVLWESRRRTPLQWTVEGMTAARWPALAPRTTLAGIDLQTLEQDWVEAEAAVDIDRAGTLDALILTFAAQLTDEIVLPGPPWAGEPSSWDTSVWVLPEAMAVEQGDVLEVRYRFGKPGTVDGVSCELR